MGDGLRLRFRKYQSDFNHLLIQRGAGVALRSERERNPGIRTMARVRIAVLGLQIVQHYLAFVGCSRWDRLGNKTGWEHQVSVRLWTDLYAHNAIEFYPPASPSHPNWKRPNRTERKSEKVSAKISKAPPGTALPKTIS
jgi:hypothetical protein